jgi:hypothetical protein
MFTKKGKDKPASPFLPPGENPIIPPKGRKVGRSRPNRKIKTRKLQTPTQAEARKASRMRGIVFASALVVIGILALLITSSSGKQASYTVYESKTYIPAGAHISASEMRAVILHSPVPHASGIGSIVHSVPITPIYGGELMQSPMLTSVKSVPAGDVLIGTSLAANHVPNSTLYAGEKVEIYYSGTQASTGSPVFNPGQAIGTAVVVSTTPASSSNSNVEVDLAVPNKIAGEVAMNVANSSVAIGLL